MPRRAQMLRKAMGKSLRDVERDLGIDHSSIGKFEEGERMLLGGNLELYAKYLDSTIDDILKPLAMPTTNGVKEPA